MSRIWDGSRRPNTARMGRSRTLEVAAPKSRDRSVLWITATLSSGPLMAAERALPFRLDVDSAGHVLFYGNYEDVNTWEWGSFLAKVNGTSGALLWAKWASGTQSVSGSFSVDSDGASYVLLPVTSARFEWGSCKPSGSGVLALLKIDGSGMCRWIVEWSPSYFTVGTVDVGPDGFVYVSTSALLSNNKFKGVSVVGNTPTSVPSTAALLAKFTTTGSVVWARALANASIVGENAQHSLAFGPCDALYHLFSIKDTSNFHLGGMNYTTYQPGFFLTKLNANTAKITGSTYLSLWTSFDAQVRVGNHGRLYIAGTVSGDVSSGGVTVTGNQVDVFLMELNGNLSVIVP